MVTFVSPVSFVVILYVLTSQRSNVPTCQRVLVQSQRFDDDVILPHDARQPRQQLGAVRGGVVGELDPVAARALEDLQGEAVVPRIRDQDAVALP